MKKHELVKWLKDYDDEAEILVSVDMVKDPEPERFRRIHGEVNEIVPVNEDITNAILCVEGEFNYGCVFAELEELKKKRFRAMDALRYACSKLSVNDEYCHQDEKSIENEMFLHVDSYEANDAKS